MQAQTFKEKTSLWSNTGLDISLDTLGPISTKDKPTQPSMNQMTGQQLMSNQTTMQPLAPTMSSPNSMYGTNMAQVNTGMSSMSLGTGAVGPMQMGAQPMQQPMVMNAQTLRMNAQAMSHPRPHSMGMGTTMPNMGMTSNHNMMHYGNAAAMQYNYQPSGMRMPMQAQMYQSQMQGTMGQFRS